MEMPKGNLNSICTQVRRTWGIIHQKPTQERYIATLDLFTCTQRILPGSCQEQLHPALGEGVLKPLPIPTTRESHYQGFQDTESWINKPKSPNSPIWYKDHIGTKCYEGTQYYYQEISLGSTIMTSTNTSDECTTHIVYNRSYS